MKISRQNIFTGEINTLEINVTQEQLDKWHNGALIQNAMPNIPPEHREFIMTGITPDEWNKMFKNSISGEEY